MSELRSNDGGIRMNAVKFLKEANRMCRSSFSCEDCLLRAEKMCVSDIKEGEEEKVVKIVEQWSKDQPIITNLMKFEEVFGKCDPEVTASFSWWNEEYHEPERG